MAKKNSHVFQWSRDARRVQVLAGGDALRIFDHTGRARMVYRRHPHSEELLGALLDTITAADPECAERIVAELPESWRPS